MSISFSYGFRQIQKIPPSEINQIFTFFNQSFDLLLGIFTSSFFLWVLSGFHLFGRSSQWAAVQESFHFVFEEGIFLNDSIVPSAILLRIFSVLNCMPKVVVPVEAFPHLSSAWLVYVADFQACFSLDYSDGNLFDLWEFDNNFFDEIFICLLNDLRLLLLLLFFLIVFKGLNERLCGDNFHKFEREDSNFVGFNVLFNHTSKLDDLISIFLFLVLNLSCDFERLMLLAKD